MTKEEFPSKKCKKGIVATELKKSVKTRNQVLHKRATTQSYSTVDYKHLKRIQSPTSNIHLLNNLRTPVKPPTVSRFSPLKNKESRLKHSVNLSTATP